ncbi:M50 family metallopeptidase [Shewanella intestini]|uniref:M50 family metallopeptidase n=1 Tax=Shewanella intestini TaxID=2017544 RepID=A0ABS5HZ68_9GAMM|nr:MULTISPECIES: M50 family metallopeptidase [Shewanella]MBR9727087.1 M50 family metallopeptidase [Shewanella intestini]MRG35889.1 M50 family peptidase [Shewanella sp. XMDDZSB0408]
MPNSIPHSQHTSAVPSRSRFVIELFIAFLITKLPVISIPFKWFESFFHEISHGIATILTGGFVSSIQLFPNGAGLCTSHGGVAIIISFSGYLGAALWGYLIFLLATWQQGIKFTLSLLAATVLGALVFWARDLLTIVILLFLAVLFLLPLKVKKSRFLNSLLRTLGIMIMLNAMASPMVLFGLNGQGDAAMLASLTWIPAWIWVCIWLAISVMMLWFSWMKVNVKGE